MDFDFVLTYLEVVKNALKTFDNFLPFLAPNFNAISSVICIGIKVFNTIYEICEEVGARGPPMRDLYYCNGGFSLLQ